MPKNCIIAFTCLWKSRVKYYHAIGQVVLRYTWSDQTQNYWESHNKGFYHFQPNFAADTSAKIGRGGGGGAYLSALVLKLIETFEYL